MNDSMFLKKTFACCFSEEEFFVGQATNNGGKNVNCLFSVAAISWVTFVLQAHRTAQYKISILVYSSN
jgi:hypothetical protein